MKTALLFGGSRGIGASIARRLAMAGWHVIITAKTSSANPSATAALPGTIEQVRDEILAAGGSASCAVCDVRDTSAIRTVIDDAIKRHGSIDAVVYNAGAVHWGTVESASLKKFELLQEVNMRGFYAAVVDSLPHFRAMGGVGRIVGVCPPIYSRFFRGKTSYAVGKVGMSVLTMGLAMELEGTEMAITGLWPATAVQSFVTDVKNVPGAVLRTPEIFADAVLGILEDTPANVNGMLLLDEDYLREYRGVTDFARYRVDPNHEPPRMMPKEFPSLLVAEQDDRGMTMKQDTSKL